MIEPGVSNSIGENITVSTTAGILSGLVGFIVIVCTFWITYEIAKKHRKWHIGKKLLWIVCAVLFNVLTVIIYYFTEYKKK